MTAIVASAGLIEPAPSTHRPRTALLTLGAAGVVFGDIGTSPLYAMKEVFVGHHPLAVDRLHIFGALSLMFWSLMLIVTIKYVGIILRADNKGEGGSLSLLALIQRSTGGGKWDQRPRAPRRRRDRAVLRRCDDHAGGVGAVGGRGTGDGQRGLQRLRDPAGDRHSDRAVRDPEPTGRTTVGKLFGPVMLFYFVVIAVLGVRQIAQDPLRACTRSIRCGRCASSAADGASPFSRSARSCSR